MKKIEYIKNLSELVEKKFGKVDLYLEEDFEDIYVKFDNGMSLMLIFNDDLEEMEDEEDLYIGKYYDTDIECENHVWLQTSYIPLKSNYVNYIRKYR